MLSLKEKALQSILLVSLVLLIIYFYYQNLIFLIASLVLAILGVLSTRFRNFFHTQWMQLAHLLGRINGTILLTLIYFIVLTPIALLKRIIEGNSKPKDNIENKSNFKTRNHQYEAKDLMNPW